MNMLKDTPLQILNGLKPSQFLSQYWQKKPLLIKNAISDFNGLLSPNELAGLACEEDVQSRIVQNKANKWQLKNGPFAEGDFAKLPLKDWTLLVQSVNHHLQEAAELLSRFNFIPHARLDDLMVSYAPDGGGVGAHIDSYDVFLLQGSGRRNWKISSQTDFALLEDAPLKILKNFCTEQEWTLEAGDMLYLPPQIAHWGVAVGDNCMTYSIGFRAPKKLDLAHEFLAYMQDKLSLDGQFNDPDLSLQKHPAEISENTVAQVKTMLQEIKWNAKDVADFLGCYLTEPKLNVFFDPPTKTTLPRFIKLLATKTLALDLKSQLLFSEDYFYLNGEKLELPPNLITPMQSFANNKSLNTSDLQPSIHEALGAALFESYLAGYILFN